MIIEMIEEIKENSKNVFGLIAVVECMVSLQEHNVVAIPTKSGEAIS